MKLLSIAAGIALALSANVATAQDTAGGAGATDSTIGGMDKDKVAAGAAGLAVLGAIIANNRGSVAEAPVEPPVECGPGEELVDGECVPVPTTTVTSTVTSTVTGTNTVTSTTTTPVTVTATTTL